MTVLRSFVCCNASTADSLTRHVSEMTNKCVDRTLLAT